MKSDFKWQKEEHEWEQDQVPENTVTRRYFWTYLIGLLLLVLAVTIFIQQRHKRIAEAPHQLIELTCQTEETGTTANYWYDPAREKWLDKTRLFDDTNSTNQTALDENSFLLEEVVEHQEGPHWRLSLWQDDTLFPLVDTPTRRQKSLTTTDPTHRKLIFTEQDASSGIPLFYLLDLDACQTAECSLISLPGPVIWSPNGERSLISNLGEGESPFTLFLGDSAAIPERQLAAGFARAWIDNQHFIYQPYEQPDDNETQWLVSSIAGETLAVLSTADIANFSLSSTSEFSPRILTSVVPNPLNPDEILVTTSGMDVPGDARASLIFRYNWRTNMHEQIHVTPDPAPDIQLSPDGRWLIIHESVSDDSPGQTTVILLDLTTNEQQTIDEGSSLPPGSVWSADSQWLLSLHQDLLFIINPARNKQQAVPLPNAPCLRAKWVPNH